MIQNCRIIARTVARSNICSTAYNHQLTRTFKKTVVSRARIVENVPVLGESITEGSIASWSKNIGDSVEIDDVIVIIETDKVTVDIKSTNAGILTAYLADDTVIVGAPLYELETDAQAIVGKITTADQVPPVSTVVADQAPPVSTVESNKNSVGTGSSHARVPSIKFLGKRSLIKPVAHNHLKEFESPVLQQSKTTPVAPREIKQGNGVDFSTLQGGAMFGRPALSQKEIDAIESGFYMEP